MNKIGNTKMQQTTKVAKSKSVMRRRFAKNTSPSYNFTKTKRESQSVSIPSIRALTRKTSITDTPILWIGRTKEFRAGKSHDPVRYKRFAAIRYWVCIGPI